MEDGRKIVFKEKADEMPGCITGDVILVVAQVACARLCTLAAFCICSAQCMASHVQTHVKLRRACGVCARAIEANYPTPIIGRANRQAQHPTFKRQGPHLTMEKEISLRDAVSAPLLVVG